jgi:pimeloyl-ACP methyl ester carboxylesterase
VSFEEAALVVPGATLHVVSVGPPSARPLLVLHGGPGEAHDCLRPWLDGLSSLTRRVVYYDQRGGGRSALAPGAEPVGWEGHARDVDAVRAYLGVERVDLLGFSWGALLGLLTAIAHKDSIARLVLVSPPPTSARHAEAMRDNERRAAARPEVGALFARLDATEAHDAESARRARFIRRAAPYFADPARVLEVTPVDTREECARAVASSLQTSDPWSSLDTLRTVPSMVMHGAHDPIPSASAAETAERIGARRVVFERAGHAVFVESAEDFVREATAFLDGAGRP